MAYLNLEEMLTGNPTRLRYIIRFSTCHRLHNENVAEHSYYVALYAMFVVDWFNQEHPCDQIHMGEVLKRCLIHDLEEARSGDFPRPFKYSSERLRSLLEEAAEDAFEQVITPVVGTVRQDRWVDSWRNTKDHSLEGRVVKFADFLSVCGYLLSEVRESNDTISEHISTLQEYFTIFASEHYDFLRPLIVQCEAVLKDHKLL